MSSQSKTASLMLAATSEAMLAKRGASVTTMRAPGLADRLDDRLEVQRHHRAQVDHLGIDAVLRPDDSAASSDFTTMWE